MISSESFDRQLRRPDRQIRARFDANTIRVYQAYSDQIADAALVAQTFVAPFKMTRMTWIKPSFLWMMYRTSWATQQGQERVLAIDVSREGFEWALGHACLSHFAPDVHGSRDAWIEHKQQSPVRIQWDPERDSELQRLSYRSIQIGLSSTAVEKYVRDWIQAISDVTPVAAELRRLDADERRGGCTSILGEELPYPVPQELCRRIGMTPHC